MRLGQKKHKNVLGSNVALLVRDVLPEYLPSWAVITTSEFGLQMNVCMEVSYRIYVKESLIFEDACSLRRT